MSRLFYDPSNPMMLSEDQVARLSSAEVQVSQPTKQPTLHLPRARLK